MKIVKHGIYGIGYVIFVAIVLVLGSSVFAEDDITILVPSLRNVALTASYFHNGDVRTLREVVELYSRGGNVAPIFATDGTLIEPLGVPVLTSDEIDAIVAFLKTLTDERVLYQRAPFDHPQIFVPNGHPGDHSSTVDANGDGLADDVMVEIPAIGAEGGDPLPGFLEGIFGPN